MCVLISVCFLCCGLFVTSYGCVDTKMTVMISIFCVTVTRCLGWSVTGRTLKMYDCLLCDIDVSLRDTQPGTRYLLEYLFKKVSSTRLWHIQEGIEYQVVCHIFAHASCMQAFNMCSSARQELKKLAKFRPGVRYECRHDSNEYALKSRS